MAAFGVASALLSAWIVRFYQYADEVRMNDQSTAYSIPERPLSIWFQLQAVSPIAFSSTFPRGPHRQPDGRFSF
jgi:hypothetical protein